MKKRTTIFGKECRKEGMDWGRLAFGCVWLAFLSVMAWVFVRMAVAPSLKDWDPVSCRIVKSSVKMENVKEFAFTAEYAYEWLGRRHVSHALSRPGADKHSFKRVMSRLPLLEKYAPGTEHECRVNPKDPSDAVLAVDDPVEDPDSLPGNVGSVAAGIVMLLFYLIGVFMLATAFPGTRRLGTPRTTKLLAVVVFVLFGCPFAIVGSYSCAKCARERSAAKEFVPVPAKVLYSGLYSSRSGGRHSHTTYGVRVGYEYVVDGKKYESDRLSVSQVSSSNYDHHRRVADRYKKGDAVTAYVSPVDPRNSVLEKPTGIGDIGAVAIGGLFGFVGFMLVGGGLWMLLSLFRGKADLPHSFENRPLRRSHAELAALGLFAVVWNVFSWTIVLIFVGEEQGLRLEPALLVVAVFPAVGLLLLGCFVVKLVRELRAPRLALTLSCARWEHGSPAHVNWSLDDPEVVEALEIFLESSKMEGSGKRSRKVVVSSQRCCCHVKPMVPAVGSFGIEVPSREGERRSWAVVAKLKVRGFRREITATYALPRCQCQSLFQDA